MKKEKSANKTDDRDIGSRFRAQWRYARNGRKAWDSLVFLCQAGVSPREYAKYFKLIQSTFPKQNRQVTVTLVQR